MESNQEKQLEAVACSPLVDSLARNFGEQPGLAKDIEGHARRMAVALEGMLLQDCNHPGTNVTKYARTALRDWKRINKANLDVSDHP